MIYRKGWRLIYLFIYYLFSLIACTDLMSQYSYLAKTTKDRCDDCLTKPEFN